MTSSSTMVACERETRLRDDVENHEPLELTTPGEQLRCMDQLCVVDGHSGGSAEGWFRINPTDSGLSFQQSAQATPKNQCQKLGIPMKEKGHKNSFHSPDRHFFRSISNVLSLGFSENCSPDVSALAYLAGISLRGTGGPPGMGSGPVTVTT